MLSKMKYPKLIRNNTKHKHKKILENILKNIHNCLVLFTVSHSVNNQDNLECEFFSNIK